MDRGVARQKMYVKCSVGFGVKRRGGESAGDMKICCEKESSERHAANRQLAEIATLDRETASNPGCKRPRAAL